MFKQYQNIHFVGIGGIGMSGIAELLLNLGYQVSGSDQKRSPITIRLKKKGARVYYQHKASQVEGAHVVVVSSAIHKENPEVDRALRLNIPVIPRAEMLAELMRLKYGIAVAGSHGKTTTTSLIGQVLLGGGLDPTLVIGGKLNSLRSNAKLGKGNFLVAEADESDGSFLKLNPTFGIITNIDPEHMDHYKDFETLKNTFVDFANKVPFYGSVIVCQDHPVVAELLPLIKRKVIRYGIKGKALDYQAKKIEWDGSAQSFEVHQGKKNLGKIKLPMPGEHNVLNTLAAIALARELEISFTKIKEALRRFKGVQRRLQHYLDAPVTLIDDYAHHPVELKATLKALRQAYKKNKIKAIFQPHRYTRTKHLFEDFVTSFKEVDELYLLDIYPAGEKPIVGISSEALAKACDHPKVHYYSSRLALEKHLKETLASGEVLVTLGAGDVFKLCQLLARGLKGAD